MNAGHKMIVKPRGAKPSDFEATVAQEIFNVGLANEAIMKDLRTLQLVGARELELEDGTKAVLLFVPFPQLVEYRKVQKILVEELEKKFSKNVVIIAQRTMLHPTCGRNPRHKGPRPRSRTLTAVHEAILDDVVYPADITGKRTRFHLDGSRTMTCRLSRAEAGALEGKLGAFAGIVKALTNKDVVFEFEPASERL